MKVYKIKAYIDLLNTEEPELNWSGIRGFEIAKRLLDKCRHSQRSRPSRKDRMADVGITNEVTFDNYTFLASWATSFNKIAAHLIYRLRERGASTEDIEAVLSIVEKYEEK